MVITGNALFGTQKGLLRPLQIAVVMFFGRPLANLTRLHGFSGYFFCDPVVIGPHFRAFFKVTKSIYEESKDIFGKIIQRAFRISKQIFDIIF